MSLVPSQQRPSCSDASVEYSQHERVKRMPVRHWILICAVVLSTTSAAAGDSAIEDEAMLRQIKTELWPRLYREQDVAGLDSLLHPSFQMLDGSGTRSTKAQELAYVAANKPSYLSFNFEIARLDVYPNGTAIVDGVGRVQQDACRSFEYVSSNILIKQQGYWRAVASHVSGGKSVESGSDSCAPSND